MSLSKYQQVQNCLGKYTDADLATVTFGNIYSKVKDPQANIMMMTRMALTAQTDSSDEANNKMKINETERH